MILPADFAMASEAMPLGDGIAATFTMTAARGIEVSFSRPIPKGRKARRYLDPYRRARDEFLRRVSDRIGLTVGVVEL